MRATTWLLAAIFLASHCGCVGMLAQMGYWTGANLIPAEYEGLENERVAVICVSSNASYGVGIEAELLARGVSSILKENVKGIDLVEHDEIADWVDKNDWDEVDYREVGRGVKASKVVAIDLSGFRLYEGQTLYRGRAVVTVTVLDIEEGGKEAFRRQLPEIKFPTTGVYHSSETSETAFRRAFLQVVARQVGHYFHDYDPIDRYNRDPASLD
jgi:hypothetical protein